jgi:DNA-binding PucR family transcriptional regulator
MTAMPLDRLLDGMIGTLVEAPVLPPGGPPPVGEVAILDPADEFGDHHGELVLLIGSRGRDALPFVRAAARGGAVAVAVKVGPGRAELAAAALEAGLALLPVPGSVRWDQLGGLLKERLEAADADREAHAVPFGASPGHAHAEDLYALAETTAALTGGIVSIEDSGHRVLAYSRSDEAVDELRRLSILGWQGPESYLRMLRQWGVFDRLRARDQVVRLEEHPELGIRARLAVGVHAGSRFLGTVWVQQRSAEEPFRVGAEAALLGSARLVAAEIMRRRAGLGSGAQAHDLLVELLDGRANIDLAAGRLGLDPNAPALVVAFGGPVDRDPSARPVAGEAARGVVAVYATAYHRGARVALANDRVYGVLCGESALGDRAALGWVAQAVSAIGARVGRPWRGGIGSPVPTLAGLTAARVEADRVLDVLLRRGAGGSSSPLVAGIAELRAEMLVDELLEVLAARPELAHPGIAALVEHDRDRGGELVGSLLAYLDALGDVRAASAALHVHPNTLRHRLRRALSLSGLSWEDPRERLACHVELLLASRGGTAPAGPAS